VCTKFDTPRFSHAGNGSKLYKKLSYSRGTAPRAMSVEVLLTVAQLYGKSHLKKLAAGE